MSNWRTNNYIWSCVKALIKWPFNLPLPLVSERFIKNVTIRTFTLDTSKLQVPGVKDWRDAFGYISIRVIGLKLLRFSDPYSIIFLLEKVLLYGVYAVRPVNESYVLIKWTFICKKSTLFITESYISLFQLCLHGTLIRLFSAVTKWNFIIKSINILFVGLKKKYTDW